MDNTRGVVYLYDYRHYGTVYYVSPYSGELGQVCWNLLASDRYHQS
jgi:hypothetical protein